MTELDVLNAYEDNIEEWCRRFGRGLEKQDRREIARAGFLCAIRTYRKGLSEFLPYAKECVFNVLKNERVRRNRMKRIESDFSLDMPVDGEESPSIGQLYHGVGDFVNGVLFYDFMKRLSEDIQATAWLFVDQFTTAEIMQIRHLSREELSWHITRIKCEWEGYNSEVA